MSLWHEVETVDEADMDGVDGKEAHEDADDESGKNKSVGTDKDDDVVFTGSEKAADLGSGSCKADKNFKLPGSTKLS